jgi:3-dehydroquinate dehydratase-2
MLRTLQDDNTTSQDDKKSPNVSTSSGNFPIIRKKKKMSAMANIQVIHGPNLDKLGAREPHTYGKMTLAEINASLTDYATARGHRLECFQSNAEHLLIETIHRAKDQAVDFMLINLAAYTHTSIALRDALLYSRIPFIEIHLSNVLAREPYRHQSLIGDIAIGLIQGFGANSYLLALEAAHQWLSQPTTPSTEEESCCGHA